MSEHQHDLPAQCALPNRRTGIIAVIRHTYYDKRTRDMSVGFNFGDEARRDQIVEVFAVPEKTGNELDAMLSDACTGYSIALRSGGATIAALAERMAENREEGAEHGVPASIFGTILRAGVAIESGEASPYIVQHNAEVVGLHQ